MFYLRDSNESISYLIVVKSKFLMLILALSEIGGLFISMLSIS